MSEQAPERPRARFFSSEGYHFPIAEDHRFPIAKYALLRERLVSEGIFTADEIAEAPLAGRDDLLRAHDPDYVDGFFDGSLEPRALRRIGLPACSSGRRTSRLRSRPTRSSAAARDRLLRA